jgi:small subunit ribosomal protein S5
MKDLKNSKKTEINQVEGVDQEKIVSEENNLPLDQKLLDSDNKDLNEKSEKKEKNQSEPEISSSSFFSKNPFSPDNLKLKEVVIKNRRVVKVTKGGRRFSFTALVVSGNENGWVGYGEGRAREARNAIQKAKNSARKNMINVKLTSDKTLPHKIQRKFKSSFILFKPAHKGVGIKAGGATNIVLSLLGLKNVYAKSLNSRNPLNVVKSTFKSLQAIRPRSYYYKLHKNSFYIKKNKLV